MKTYKLAYFVSHPIQYQAPLLKKLSDHPQVDLTVFFLSGASTRAYHDPGFNQSVEWDVPLTDGYSHHFLDSTETADHHSLRNPKVRLSSVQQALGQKQWDAIWVHGYNNTALLHVIGYAFWNSIPMLFRGESNLTSTSQNFLKNKFIRLLIARAHGLLWISSDNRDYYTHFGANESQLFFTPYAVNNEFFQKFGDPTKKENSHVTILFASKFIARKNASMLVQAFAEVKPELRDEARLWLIGSGEESRQIEKIVNENNLSDKVQLLGFKNQSELPRYINECDVFVLPSEREPFGLVINEAMNLGKAILTTSEVGAARDLIEDGVNGWVVEAGSKDSLVNALSTAILEKKRLKDMGQKSLHKINNWSYDEDVAGILAALDAIG